MEIIVEGPESFANDSYTQLLERTLVDMGITTSIDKVKLIIKPAEPLFIVSIRTRKAGGSRLVSEISTIEEKEGGTFISINDENYAPRLISLLWRTFGRERVEQITRLEILAKGTTAKEIETLRLDPEEELKKKNGALQREIEKRCGVKLKLVEKDAELEIDQRGCVRHRAEGIARPDAAER